MTAHYKMLLFRGHSERLLKLEGRGADNLTINLDVDAVGTDSECARTRVVYVLTAINSEV